MFMVNFDRTFKRGTLKGLTVPGQVRFPTRNSAYRYVSDMVKMSAKRGNEYSNFAVTEQHVLFEKEGLA